MNVPQGSASVRRMKKEDLAAVIALEEATAEAPHWSRADYKALLSEEAETNPALIASLSRAGLVADVEGRIVGFLVLRRLRVSPAELHWELESVVVEVTERRKGVGMRLMQAAFDQVMTMGGGRLELEVRAGNEAAILLYSRAGMRVDGRRPGYYSGPVEDAILMSKHI